MGIPSQLAAVLDKIQEAQKIIDEQIDLIGDTLDKALLKNGNFDHLTIEELEACISALPQHCFYSVELKRAWRNKTQQSKKD